MFKVRETLMWFKKKKPRDDVNMKKFYTFAI